MHSWSRCLRASSVELRTSHRSHKTSLRMLSHFRVVEHVVPCQHTRQYPLATAPGFERDLKLAVKQYIPTAQQPQPGDITIIGAHANGFPKELYEPLWDDLYERLSELQVRIRGIWIADVAQQGRSGILNQDVLGNDPGWLDHARDLIYLINQKQAEMPSPLVGIGHSMGGTQLTYLSLIHPTLLNTLILMDPVLKRDNPSKPYALASTYRRDTWPSREDAKNRFESSKFYQSWDRRFLKQWIDYGLRPVTGQNDGSQAVTLTTPKAQEVFTFLRPTYKTVDSAASPLDDHLNYPDLLEDQYEEDFQFYKPDPRQVYDSLPLVRSNVLYICGKTSPLSTAEVIEERYNMTGAGAADGARRGFGSNKGLKVLDCGHFVPMEKPKETADAVASFVKEQMVLWEKQKKYFEDKWNQKPRDQQLSIDDEWREHIGPKSGSKL